MEIKNTTVYTKERVLKSAYHFAKNQRFLWIVLPVCTFISYFFALVQIIFSELDLYWAMSCLFFTLLDIVLPLMLFVFLPRTVIKQSKALDATLEYTFTDDEITLYVNKSDVLEEKTTMKYNALVKAEKTKDTLYLYIQPRNAFVVDLSMMLAEEREQLRSVLESNLKKVKWK